MKKIYITICLIFNVLAFACSRGDEQNNQKPNLLIIHTDEHNFRTLGCYRELLPADQAFVWGEGVKVETPNIDWLAENGILFSKCYASTPVCGPSRGAFVTGMYPQHTGVSKNDVPMHGEMITFAKILQDNGYFTAYVGKWHLDGEGKPQWEPQRNFGFQDNRYMYNRGHWKKLEDTPDGPRVASVNEDGVPNYNLDGADEHSFTTDFLSDRTMDLISNNKEDPFCIMLSIPDPHGPDRVRPPYDQMYTGLTYSAPATYDKADEGVPSWAQKKDNASINQAQYFGMVKCIDDNVGKIIDFLRTEDLLENTIVVFTSDHGDLRGEHHRHNKGVPLEASAKIPFIISFPQQVPKGAVVHNAISTVDFAPTILELMGIGHHVNMQGKDYSQVVTDPATFSEIPDIAFVRSTGTVQDGEWIGSFSSRYKLILSAEDDPWLLDLEQDPDELHNHILEAGNESIVRDLAIKLQAYATEFQDPFLQNTKMSDDLGKLLQ
jgi:arylsulfatase A-like enzyme